MKLLSTAITLLTLLCASASAHLSDEVILIATEGETAKTVDISEQPQENADSTRVSILGYHDFSSTKKATDMMITTEDFRKQMQSLKDINANIISMEDFIAWKKGEKKIEDKSIVITIDDGWKSVYTEAYPVLKEFGYPFTVFLYTDYVDGGGSALTTKMIKEMQKNGCTIGSHSISHPYPSKVKKEKAKGEESFTKYLQHQLGDSRKKLEEKFGAIVNSYAYPGGFVCDEMLPIAEEFGYDCMFTVLPGKATIASPSLTIPRYIILGKREYNFIFRNATTFETTAHQIGSDGAVIPYDLQPVSPKLDEVIKNRLPLITADLSKVENIDPQSIIMTIPGYGAVPAVYDTTTKILSWQVHRRIRSTTCEVSVQWKDVGSKNYHAPMTWSFSIDRDSAYILNSTDQ